MAIDVARSAHVGNVAFWRNAGTRQPVRWYPVPAHFPALGIPTRFSNPIWLPDKVGNDVAPGEVGEDQYPARYDKGRPPIFLRTPRSYCGSARQWEEGSEFGVDPPLVFTDLGFSTCCLNAVNPGFGAGGIAVAGGALWGGLLPTGGVAVGGGAYFPP